MEKVPTITKLLIPNLRHYRFIILFGLISMVAGSCQKDQDHIKKTIPFNASFTTTSEVVQAGTAKNPTEIDHIFGWGEEAHIGKIRMDVYATSDINDQPPKFFITTKGTFTAANGDQIFTASAEETNAPDFVTGEISFTGHISITGGTGRFKGATGNLLSVVSGNIFSTVTDTFTGNISY